jgi:hypothetical protein
MVEKWHMTDDKRNNLLTRIRNLRQRTVENGCTEAEAVQAIEMVTKLLDAYGFSEKDLALPVEPITEDTYFGGPGTNKAIGQLIYAVPAIAEYCDCKAWQQSVDGKAAALCYLGRESDVAVAMYLTHLIHTAAQRAWQDYLPNRDVRLRRGVERRAVSRGFAIRIAKRLREMKAARSAHIDPESGRTGQQLVVLKNAVVDAAWAEKNLKLRQGGKGRNLNASRAMAAGWEAGGQVAINPGVGGQAVRRIK